MSPSGGISKAAVASPKGWAKIAQVSSGGGFFRKVSVAKYSCATKSKQRDVMHDGLHLPSGMQSNRYCSFPAGLVLGSEHGSGGMQ